MLDFEIRKNTSVAIAASSIASTFPIPWQQIGTRGLDWRYAIAGVRDLRLDLLRGFAIFVMVINHWGGASWLYAITGENKFWVSAAEAFVLLSGLVAGIVYGKIAERENLRAAQIKMWKRAFTLYKLTIALTLLVTAFAFLTQLEWKDGVALDNPLAFAIDLLTLHQVITFTDIPLLYTFLFLLAPLGLWLMRAGRTAWLLIGSGALWLYAFTTKMYLPWEVNGGYAFNPGAWQFLFFLAMSMGYHWDAIQTQLSWMRRAPVLFLLALIVALMIQFYNSDISWLILAFPNIDIPTILYEAFRKIALGPGRILATLVMFQFAYLALTLMWRPIAASVGWLLIPLGQNSLYGYTLHVALIALFTAIARALPIEIARNEWLNTSLQLSAVLVIWFLMQRRFLFRVIPR